MTVLQQILDWSKDRPRWQRDALRRLVVSGHLSDEDIDALVEICKAEQGLVENVEANYLSEEHVPQSGEIKSPVILESIFHDKGVNALAENQSLKFSPGLTLVYGDNGAGKTGYIRILKQACRSRGQEEILGNVVSGVTPSLPAVCIKYKVGDEQQPRQWQGGDANEFISRVSIFDTQCAAVYLKERTDVAFLPYGLDLFDKLVRACKVIRAKLEADQRSLNVSLMTNVIAKIPVGTEVAKLVNNITSLTKLDVVQKLTQLSSVEEDRLVFLEKALKDLEANNPERLISQLNLRISRIRTLLGHTQESEAALSDEEVSKVFNVRGECLKKSQESKRLSDVIFSEGNLQGTGSEPWMVMWESARLFSQNQAYKDQDFPALEEGALCVLCQKEIDHETAHRLRKFGQFVTSAVERELIELRDELSRRRGIFVSLVVNSDAVVGVINELLLDYEVKARAINSAIHENEKRRLAIVLALEENKSLADDCPPLTSSSHLVQSILIELEARIEALKNSPGDDVRMGMFTEAQELRARVLLRGWEQVILSEIENKRKIAAYGQCIEETRPNAITQKSSSVTKAIVSERLKSKFKEELKHLTFNHVEVELKEVGGVEGVFYHKLVLTRNPGIEVPKVVSEGEQRCISIAAFFAEISTADDPSGIVFDDPVSSLDFQWRSAVARRLVNESKHRQVIVFTHDIVFLLSLKRYADEAGIQPLDQHIRRQINGAGVCAEELPWVAMPIKGKIGFLKNSWQEADRESRAGNQDVYEKEAIYLYGLLREAWERALEEVLLGGVVERYTPSVHTQRLAPLSDISVDDCKAVEIAMTKCSVWLPGHDQAAAARAPVPSADQLRADILSLESWVKGVRDRRK